MDNPTDNQQPSPSVGTRDTGFDVEAARLEAHKLIDGKIYCCVKPEKLAVRLHDAFREIERLRAALERACEEINITRPVTAHLIPDDFLREVEE